MKVIASHHQMGSFCNTNHTTVTMDTAKTFTKRNGEINICVCALGCMDSATDTCNIGGKAWIIDCITARIVQVAGFHHKDTTKDHIKTQGGITALDLLDGKTIPMRMFEASLLGDDTSTFFQLPKWEIMESSLMMFPINVVECPTWKLKITSAQCSSTKEWCASMSEGQCKLN